MYFKRLKRPHIESMPDRHEGYRLEIWNGTKRAEDKYFNRMFSDVNIKRAYSEAVKRYPESDILLFDVVVTGRRKYVPVPAEETLRNI